MKLRPYQVSGIDQIREAYNKGYRKVLLHLATGAGKTVIFCYILNKLAGANAKAAMIVKGRMLVEQASQRLFREKVGHGVLMAKHWNYRPYEKIKVCSIDTLTSRKSLPEAEMIIVDEGHQSTTDAYKEFFANYPEALILFVTATPFGPKPIDAETIVCPISMQGLIDEGYLVSARYFCPTAPDLKNVKMSGDDYNQVQLGEAMDKGELIGNVVDHWKKIGLDRPTLCFAVNVSHSQHIALRFRQAGIPAVHCDAETPDKERQQAIEDLRTGKVKVITNVNIFSTGVDIPFLGCLIMARATKSENLYLQQAGRGTRPTVGFDLETAEERLEAIAASDKPDFILLDHAGNVLRHGFITDEREANLGGIKDRKFGGLGANPPLKICHKCLAAYRGLLCPNGCPPMEGEIIEEKDGTLKEVTNLSPEEIFVMRTKATAKKNKYNWMWAYHRTRERFGEATATKFFPGVQNATRYMQKRAISNAASDYIRQYAQAKEGAQ